MSVSNCRTCAKPFWKYPHLPVPPPSGFCSMSCFENRKQRERKPGKSLSIEPPAAVLVEMREHLTEAHGTADVTAWFEACQRCETLQTRYAAALAEAS